MSTTLQLSDCPLTEFLRIASEFDSREYGYVVTPNVDHIIRYCEDEAYREIYRYASYVLLDSRFLGNLLRITTGHHWPICPGSDVTSELFHSVIAPQDRLVLIGGNSRQAEQLTEHYGLQNLCHLDPPMGFITDSSWVESCLRFIENASPFRFCLLAVGSPQQEILARMLQSRGHARGLALCIGGSVNFLTGRERRAPVWMQTTGLEWLHRLLLDPARLAKRYLVRGPRIFLLLPRMKFELRSAHAAPGEVIYRT